MKGRHILGIFFRLHQFAKTRIILSFWYTCILLFILIGFSIALSIFYNNDVSRIVLKRDFGTHVPKSLSSTELHLIAEQVRELKKTSQFDIIGIDATTLLIGAGLSYFLAGKTLHPIQKNIEDQKTFIADASHELRNPIATMQTACEIVLRTPTKTKEDYKKVVEQVFDQTQRLGRLVNDLLSLSTLESDKTRSMFQRCSLSTIVQSEITTMAPLLKKSNVVVQTSISPDVMVYGEKDKIHQLVVILLDNASKYTPEGGTISIKVLGTPSPQFSIQDTGIGIATEKQKQIFQRFYQADESRASAGAGLGLAIAQSIMHLHKGTITVKSTLGQGSTFVCAFPPSDFFSSPEVK